MTQFTITIIIVIYLSIYLFIYLSIYLFIYLFIYLLNCYLAAPQPTWDSCPGECFIHALLITRKKVGSLSPTKWAMQLKQPANSNLTP